MIELRSLMNQTGSTSSPMYGNDKKEGFFTKIVRAVRKFFSSSYTDAIKGNPSTEQVAAFMAMLEKRTAKLQ